MKNKRQKTYSLRERFRYWFDSRMSRGSLEFIRFLIAGTIVLAILMAGLIILFHFNEEGEIASVFWDSIATVLNAWMPSFEDGSIGYVIMMAITAIAGVFFTSVLIGIITSAIEEKIIELKKGNTFVLENDHMVVLGFTPGEYTLINQLILAAEGKPACIVIAEDMDSEEMQELVEENIAIPKNVRILYRSVDTSDPASIEKCSIETCQTVIVSPGNDSKVVKAILAVVVLMQTKEIDNIQINAIVAKNRHRFPLSIARAHHITTLQTDDIIAKMIAHSCTQTGLAETFNSVFNFEGAEFHVAEIPEFSGKTFAELVTRADNAVPVGVFRDDGCIINPPVDFEILEGDKILIFSEASDVLSVSGETEFKNIDGSIIRLKDSEYRTDALIIGYNETLPIVLRELPENLDRVYLAGVNLKKAERNEVEEMAGKQDLKIIYSTENPRRESGLINLAQKAKHIIILSDHEKNEEEADMDAIFMLLNLRDIRNRYNLDFNITVEMQREQSQNLVGFLDDTDFLVNSSMSSLVLAQTAENHELIAVFRELLSNKGNELFLKNAGKTGLAGIHSVRSLRHLLFLNGYILLGYVNKKKKSTFLLELDEEINLEPCDDLIVLGES